MSTTGKGSSERARTRPIRWMTAGLAVLLVVGAAWAIWNRELVLDWMRSAGPLPFFAAMAVLPALGVPVTPLFLIAGGTFGRWVGLLGSAVALGLNLTLCYWLARRIRRQLVPLLAPYRHAVPNLSGGRRGALLFTLKVKAAPGVPAFVKNYGLGVAGVPFPTYFGASMAITGLYAALLVLLGDSLLEHRLHPAVLGLGVVAAGAAGLWYYLRREGANRRTASRAPPSSPSESRS